MQGFVRQLKDTNTTVQRRLPDLSQQAYLSALNHRNEINSLAKNVFGKLTGINQDGNTPQWPVDSELTCAIVVRWGQIPIYTGDYKTPTRMENDRSRVAISLRTTRRAGDLFAQPIFYTEVHFQGDQKELKE